MPINCFNRSLNTQIYSFLVTFWSPTWNVWNVKWNAFCSFCNLYISFLVHFYHEILCELKTSWIVWSTHFRARRYTFYFEVCIFFCGFFSLMFNILAFSQYLLLLHTIINYCFNLASQLGQSVISWQKTLSLIIFITQFYQPIIILSIFAAIRLTEWEKYLYFDLLGKLSGNSLQMQQGRFRKCFSPGMSYRLDSVPDSIILGESCRTLCRVLQGSFARCPS